IIPMYLPFFFIFFLSNSIRVNSSMRIEDYGKMKSMFLFSLATAAGLIIILFIQYITFWITGNVFWKEGWLYVNLLFAIVPIMIVLPLFHRSFFNLTGNVYLGPFIMSLIFITILLSNTVSYFPL
ncbi:MAG: alpha/beta hydrolase, partial [Candidatus Marinimicrobia bacterium]|nr:alpha/beta hydrolase [Candidatus Neomarinimicrobiota bacterium]